MANNLKTGVDYFPLDVHMDDKFELIEAEFGLTGFAVIVKLYQKIYGGQGYYCEWNEDVALLFARKIGLGGNVVSEIVSAAIKRGIFDRNIYEKYRVLTSKGIQTRYFEAVSRRLKVEVKGRYLLVNVNQNFKNVYINQENVYISAENVDILKQSKLNKSKVNKSKVNKSKVNKSKVKGKGAACAAPARHKYGTYKNVLLSDEELAKLKTEFPSDWSKRIERISEYCASSGKAYKNYLATIRKWAKADESQSTNKFNNLPSEKTDYAELEEKLLDMMLESDNGG